MKTKAKQVAIERYKTHKTTMWYGAYKQQQKKAEIDNIKKQICRINDAARENHW